MSDLIDNGGYRFWDDDFSIQSAYEDCKAVFDGIADDDAFQECDTGIILYHAHEIMYALKKALPNARPKTGEWIPCDVDSRGMTNMFVCSKCGSSVSLPVWRYADNMEYDYCPNCGAKMRGDEE